MPSLGYIEFSAHWRTLVYHFTCLLGDGSPTPTGGYAGWQIVSRARSRGLVEWQGNDPLQIEVPILFDDFAAGSSVEADIRQLEKMAGLEEGMGEPPLVHFDSAGVVPNDYHDAPHLDWVISALVWGDADRNEVGNRTRQAVTVTVMQYVEDVELSSSKVRKGASQTLQARHKRPAKKKKYVVKTAESMEQIAGHRVKNGGLGNPNRWHEIQRLNPKYKDPKQKLHPGTILNMP